MKYTLTALCALLASGFCLLGGLWILLQVDFSKSDELLLKAIGFYFLGKAFFVGPLLLATNSRR